MNCPKVDKLSQYVDNLLTVQEHDQIHAHVKSCDDCIRVVEAFKGEQQFLKETLQTPTLPDDFASIVLDQIEPYEQKVVRRKSNTWKRILLSAAGIVLALGLTAALNPSFAQLIGGMFGTEQVDEGLRMATESGLGDRVNLEVTDRGITLKVEDVVADSSRVALSFQVLNQNGKPLDTHLNLADSENKIIALDQNGNENDRIGTGWREDSDYGFIEFSLRDQEATDKLTIKFDLVELNGVKGNWKLEVPVDLIENKKLTKTIPLNDAKKSAHGVVVNMKEVQFAPSSNDLSYETSFTNEEQALVKEKIQKLEEKFGEEKVNTSTSYGTAIQYHIENEEKKTIYYRNNRLLEEKGEHDSLRMLSGTGEDMEQLGQVAWNESYIPQKVNNKLTFVLDGVFKTVPSDFSVKIKPKELKNNPVSFEYEGNYITINKAKLKSEFSLRKSLIPIEKETIFQIEMKGGKEALSSELGTWILVDDKGNTYPTYQSGSILNEKDKNDRYKLNLNLKTYDLEEIPEELTLHLISVTRYYELKDKWQVPLY
ncbi:DUF4179 domain-containing protein [Psychrobacillus vulpis]|uniref:DUF4179 domain-containing protein n=1 Tax=Psychrobacillus vulpis TaxID=2325572 RepID=A0A544TRB5_9BACI|nr:DUF4179 domain-containing protein [Psychrobacillus vulpis]TQR19999.1 DUF4179 domain-containing protein [Psychrobacillus vulpis]